MWGDISCSHLSCIVYICRDKEASVAELMKSTNGVLFWDVSFLWGVHTRELEAVLSFLDTIYGATVRGFGEDKMYWKPNRNTGFMVNNYYSLLVSFNDCCFPWKSIWKQKIPS